MSNLSCLNIFKPIYSLVFIFLKTGSLFFSVKVFVRNSFLNSYFIATKSDLDLSIYYSNHNDLSSFLRFYNILKKLFPFLGELNFYNIKPNSKFNDLFSLIDLSRDPSISHFFSVDKTQDLSKSQSLGHILKFIEGDLKNILSRKARKKKWDYYFNLCQLDIIQSYDLDSILLSISKHYKLSEHEFRFLSKYYNCSNLNSFYQSLSDEEVLCFIYFFPFRWIGPSFYFERFDYDSKHLLTLTGKQQSILLYNIQSELQGLLSQLPLLLNSLTFLSHLHNIRRIVLSIQDEEHGTHKRKILTWIDELEAITVADKS